MGLASRYARNTVSSWWMSNLGIPVRLTERKKKKVGFAEQLHFRSNTLGDTSYEFPAHVAIQKNGAFASRKHEGSTNVSGENQCIYIGNM